MSVLQGFISYVVKLSNSCHIIDGFKELNVSMVCRLHDA